MSWDPRTDAWLAGFAEERTALERLVEARGGD